MPWRSLRVLCSGAHTKYRKAYRVLKNTRVAERKGFPRQGGVKLLTLKICRIIEMSGISCAHFET